MRLVILLSVLFGALAIAAPQDPSNLVNPLPMNELPDPVNQPLVNPPTMKGGPPLPPVDVPHEVQVPPRCGSPVQFTNCVKVCVPKSFALALSSTQPRMFEPFHLEICT